MVNRKFLILLICCLILPPTAGCDWIYRLLQREGAEEKEVLGEVIPFEYNPKVEELQSLLQAYGYNPGAVDGKFGVKTRVAIEAFQKDQGLKVTRFMDKKTWAQLDVINKAGLIHDGEINIQAVQVILKNAGYDPGPPDGKMGPKTLEALKALQAAHGLKPDGLIGQQTLKMFLKYIST